MKIQGKLIEVTIPEEITMKNGQTLIKCLAILETEDKYPKKIAVSLQKAELVDAITSKKLGEMIEVDVNIESREWNGKWFTEVKAWKI